LVEHGAHIFFVPHVHVPGGGGESDVPAITAVRDLLSPVERQRTTVVPPTLDAAEVKWCISRMDWFVGSRMHATIAALSTLTPTAAYAYSDKTRGVFETCGVGDEVVDARETHGAEAVALLMESFERRNESTVRLRDYVPRTVIASREQLRDVLAAAQAWREGRLPVGAIA
jgi:polysaccharide pyruvyl transferase WcaK-like protein